MKNVNRLSNKGLVLCLLGIFSFLFAGNTANAQSLLWKIEGNGLTRPSYLYGTMHSKSKKVFEFNEAVWQSFDACNTFAGELKLDSETLKRVAEVLKAGGDTTIKKFLTPQEYEKTAKLFKKEVGIDLSLVEKNKPIYIMTMIQQGSLMKGEVPKFLDQYFHDLAAADKKTIAGLETPEEQIAALSSEPYKKQIKALIKGVEEFETNKAAAAKQNAELLKLYLTGDIEGMQTFINKDKMSKKMKEKLILGRNKVMADRMIDIMKKGSLFCAVGAAHLGGDMGVLELLRKKGYTVTSVPNKFDGTGFKRIKEDMDKPKTASTEKPDLGNWVEYKSDELKFKAFFPAEPKLVKQSVDAPDGKKVEVPTVQFADLARGAQNSVTCVEDKNTEKVSKEEQQKKAKEEILKKTAAYNGKIVEEREIQVEGVSGYEMVVEVMGAMNMTMRNFTIGDKKYIMTSLRSKTDGSANEENKKFFNSFQTIK